MERHQPIGQTDLASLGVESASQGHARIGGADETWAEYKASQPRQALRSPVPSGLPRSEPASQRAESASLLRSPRHGWSTAVTVGRLQRQRGCGRARQGAFRW